MYNGVMMIYTFEILSGNDIYHPFSLNILPQLIKAFSFLKLFLGITFYQEVKIHPKL